MRWGWQRNGTAVQMAQVVGRQPIRVASIWDGSMHRFGKIIADSRLKALQGPILSETRYLKLGQPHERSRHLER